jgi:hypothetical protein
VQQSESERDDPRMPDGEAGFAAPGSNDLGAEKQDAEGDRGVQRNDRYVGVPEGRDGERDAVSYRESGYGFQQHPAVFDDQQQAEHEEDVVGAKEDVPDSLYDIRAHYAPSGLIGSKFDARLRGVNDRRPLAAVEHLNADDHIGNGELQARKLDRLTGEAVGAGLDPVALELGVGEFLRGRFLQVFHGGGELKGDRESHSGENGDPPENAELIGGGLLDFKVGRAGLMGGQGGRQKHQKNKNNCKFPQKA